MLPKSTKAGTQVDEIRETTHPGLVAEGLMAQLLALGTLHVHNTINPSSENGGCRGRMLQPVESHHGVC
jgi:hypothetical protein